MPDEPIEPPQGPSEDEPADPEPDTAERDDQPDEPLAQSDDEEPETFPREYVEKLRQENGRYRQRAHRADHYAQRLHIELVRATGKLADRTDLPFDEFHLDDTNALAVAIDKLLTRKPHLALRRPTGEIAQGTSPSASTVDLAAILRQRAR